MNPRLFLLFALLAAPGSAQPRPAVLDALVRDSPFLPSGATAAADGDTAALEFRGVVAESGGYLFSIYDPGRRATDWVKLGESGRPFVVRRFDPGRDTLVLERGGQTLTLALKRARVQALAMSAPPAAPPPLPTNTGGNQPGNYGATPPPSTNATNAQEAQRLQNMADEIRRRRALRPLPPPPGRPTDRS
ncbi:MAG: hypothetical protein HY302_08655 [Opitutae bacterium]|nr:hypothetical protein [Opitutae bacterium]